MNLWNMYYINEKTNRQRKKDLKIKQIQLQDWMDPYNLPNKELLLLLFITLLFIFIIITTFIPAKQRVVSNACLGIDPTIRCRNKNNTITDWDQNIKGVALFCK